MFDDERSENVRRLGLLDFHEASNGQLGELSMEDQVFRIALPEFIVDLRIGFIGLDMGVQLNGTFLVQWKCQLTGEHRLVQLVDAREQVTPVVLGTDLVQCQEFQRGLLVELVDHRENAGILLVQ